MSTGNSDLRKGAIKYCPSCGGNTFIMDTDLRVTHGNITRYRECKKCGHVHDTVEISQQTFAYFLQLEEAAKLTVNQITALKEIIGMN